LFGEDSRFQSYQFPQPQIGVPMPINIKGLYDPATKRCCPKRCTATAYAIGAAVSQITMSVMRVINDLITVKEQQLDQTISCVTQAIYSQVDACEIRLNNVYNDVHSQFLPKYADAVNTAERLLTEYKYETANETISKTELPVSELQGQQSDQDSSKPYEGQIPKEPPPSKVELKGNRPGCIEIDLCDDLKSILLRVVNYITIHAPALSVILGNYSGSTPKIDDTKPEDAPRIAPMVFTSEMILPDITEVEELKE
jgi:hypothetical protein